MPKREKYQSEYSHTIYSNTRSRVKSKNKKIHEKRKKEALEAKTEENLSEKPKKKKTSDGFNV